MHFPYFTSLMKHMDDHKWQIIGFTALSVSLIITRRYMYASTLCKSKARLDGKTVIITGANTGIGKETALDLAKRGARIILACRDIKKAVKAADDIRHKSGNGNVIVEYLDLASLESVKKFADKINSQEEYVHILINNAGVYCTPKWKTHDGYEMQFGVNHLGHFLLTNLLVDKLVKSAPSRIINVTSKLYESGKIKWDDINLEKSYDPLEAYKQSKLCNVLFTHELGERLKNKNVTVHLVSPGIVFTNLGRYHYHTYGFWSFLKMIIMYPLIKFIFKTPMEGAQTSIYVSVDDNVQHKYGKLYRNCKETEVLPHGKNDEDAKRLWSISEGFVFKNIKN